MATKAKDTQVSEQEAEKKSAKAKTKSGKTEKPSVAKAVKKTSAKKTTESTTTKVKAKATKKTVKPAVKVAVESAPKVDSQTAKSEKSADEAKEQPTAKVEADNAKSTVVSPDQIDLKALLEAGVHFGHQTQRWNPRMREYIYTERDGIHIFDLVKTAQQLQEAMNFARQLGKQGKTLIFIGTKRQSQEIIKEHASQAGAMYIVTRWLGGFLTNWDQVSKSIKRMNQIYSGLESGKYDKYTKFEQVQLRKEADRLSRFLEGVKDLKTVPDALFLADITVDQVAVKEAKIAGVPVMAIVDSNANPDLVDIAIPGNDDAVSSITILTSMVAQAYAEGRQSRTK